MLKVVFSCFRTGNLETIFFSSTSDSNGDKRVSSFFFNLKFPSKSIGRHSKELYQNLFYLVPAAVAGFEP
jgi:hypothetical protein